MVVQYKLQADALRVPEHQRDGRRLYASCYPGSTARYYFWGGEYDLLRIDAECRDHLQAIILEGMSVSVYIDIDDKKTHGEITEHSVQELCHAVLMKMHSSTVVYACKRKHGSSYHLVFKSEDPEDWFTWDVEGRTRMKNMVQSVADMADMSEVIDLCVYSRNRPWFLPYTFKGINSNNPFEPCLLGTDSSFLAPDNDTNMEGHIPVFATEREKRRARHGEGASPPVAPRVRHMSEIVPETDEEDFQQAQRMRSPTPDPRGPSPPTDSDYSSVPDAQPNPLPDEWNSADEDVIDALLSLDRRQEEEQAMPPPDSPLSTFLVNNTRAAIHMARDNTDYGAQSYGSWISFGLLLKGICIKPDQTIDNKLANHMRLIFHEYSRPHPKYSFTQCEDKWKSFRPTETTGFLALKTLAVRCQEHERIGGGINAAAILSTDADSFSLRPYNALDITTFTSDHFSCARMAANMVYKDFRYSVRDLNHNQRRDYVYFWTGSKWCSHQRATQMMSRIAHTLNKDLALLLHYMMLFSSKERGRAEEMTTYETFGRTFINQSANWAKYLPMFLYDEQLATSWKSQTSGLVACEDGMTMEMKDGELLIRASKPDDYQTRTISYHPNQDINPLYMEKWIQFRDSVFYKEHIRDFICTILGVALFEGNPHQLFVILSSSHGAGSNGSQGKSTLIELLHRAFCDWGSAFPGSLLQETKTDANGASPATRKLVGIRLGVASELNPRIPLNVRFIKNLTGGDTMFARDLYESTFAFDPHVLPFLAVNTVPQASERDHGAQRRYCCVSLDSIFVPEDSAMAVRVPDGMKMFRPDPWFGLKENTAKLGEAVVSDLVRYYVKYCQGGKKLRFPEEVKHFTKRVLVDDDCVATSIASMVEFTGDMRDGVCASELFDALKKDNFVMESVNNKVNVLRSEVFRIMGQDMYVDRNNKQWAKAWRGSDYTDRQHSTVLRVNRFLQWRWIVLAPWVADDEASQ